MNGIMNDIFREALQDWKDGYKISETDSYAKALALLDADPTSDARELDPKRFATMLMTDTPPDLWPKLIADRDAALLASRQGETTNVEEIADEWMSHYYFSDTPSANEYADRENVHVHLCELIRKVSQINSRKSEQGGER
jgi:hypothetical protein